MVWQRFICPVLEFTTLIISVTFALLVIFTNFSVSLEASSPTAAIDQTFFHWVFFLAPIFVIKKPKTARLAL